MLTRLKKNRSTLGLLPLFLLCSFVLSVEGKLKTDTPTLDLSEWNALSSKVKVIQPSSSPQELNWEYTYSKEPSSLVYSVKSSWGNVAAISFEIQSDHEGTLFIRMDQKDKKIFLRPFSVSTTWVKVTLPLQTLTLFGGGSDSIQADKVATVYLVDLKGKDEGAKGRCITKIRNMELSDSTSQAGSSSTMSESTTTSGTVVLNQWVAMQGSMQTVAVDNLQDVLNWQFEYSTSPSVMLHSVKGYTGDALWISFKVKSDRTTPIYLRIDQSDSKIFLKPITITAEWQSVVLTASDFQSIQNSSDTITPGLIATLYIVDLNGSDNGATGSRTLWFDDFQLSNQAPSNNTNTSLTKVPLLAYDQTGGIMRISNFVANGVSGGNWCYVTDTEGLTLPSNLVEEEIIINGELVPIPVLYVSSSQPAVLNILFWKVGTKYKVWLQADGQGTGIQKSIKNGVLLLNRELAYTRQLALQNYMATCLPVVQNEYGRSVKRLADALKKADLLKTSRLQAVEFDSILSQLMDLSTNAVRMQSLSLLTKQTTSGSAVVVPAPESGLLKVGSKGQIRLVDTDFRISFSQSFGFLQSNTPSDQIEAFYKELRKIGFNHYVLPLFWDQVVNEDGTYKSLEWEQSLSIDKLQEIGFHSYQTHGSVQQGRPNYVKEASKEEFSQLATSQLRATATDFKQRYTDEIKYWEAINEPSSNTFGGLTALERVNMVSNLIAQLRSTVDHGKIFVNDYDWGRGVNAQIPWDNRDIVSTYEFYKELMKKENKPDFFGLEWYPGARVDQAQFLINISEPCRDLLDTHIYWKKLIGLGCPLMISEFNVPGSMKTNDLNGYAWGMWDRQSQAAAAVDILRLALSTPDCIGWVWWSVTDAEPWNRDGGLYTNEYVKKPVLEKIEAAIADLKKPFPYRIATANTLAFPTYPGVYEITTESGKSWMVQRQNTGELTLFTPPTSLRVKDM